MSTTLIKLPVFTFKRIESPLEREGKRMYIASVQAKHLPPELDNWRKINPRDPSLTSGVAKNIAKSLEESPRSFFFKNRGITLLAAAARYDGESKSLHIELSDPKHHGMLDGGHSFRVIREALESIDDADRADLEDAYVRLEVLEGFTDASEIVDIVEARNTSTQVKDQSLEELKGHFEAVKKALEGQTYANRIAYREIELADDGSKKDIDIKEVLSYLVCFDVEAFDGKKHPIMAYNSKSAVLDHFSKKENRERLIAYLPLLPQILALKDVIYKEMPETYNKATDGKFGKLSGVMEISGKKRRSPIELPFTGESSTYVIPSSFVYPVLASMRNLVQLSEGKVSWKRDPIAFFETVKDELVQRVVEQAKEIRNPTKLGRDNATWGRCYDYAALEVLKLKI